MRAGSLGMPMAAVAAALVCVLLAGQWAASATAPAGEVADTGRLLGKTGFAYLGGIRTFAAAVLWNRIDPQFHEYYNSSLDDSDYMLPTLRMVVGLDPQFTQAYQMSSYLIFRDYSQEQGIEIAREGMRNNPYSGAMRANLAQLLLISKNAAYRAEAVEVALGGLAPDIMWADGDAEYEGLAVMRSVLTAVGDASNTAQIAEITHRMEELREGGAGTGDHDHDGDGVQDH